MKRRGHENVPKARLEPPPPPPAPPVPRQEIRIVDERRKVCAVDVCDNTALRPIKASISVFSPQEVKVDVWLCEDHIALVYGSVQGLSIGEPE